ncbi:MAG: heme-binding protein [Gammaproteobacteria bacterium]
MRARSYGCSRAISRRVLAAGTLLTVMWAMQARQVLAQEAASRPAAAAEQSPPSQSQASHWPGWPPPDIKRGEPAARGPASDLALEAVQAAVATCTKNGFKSAALVVDSVGEPVAMFKADGAPRIDLASATRKAFVVIYTKKPSADAAARVKADAAFAQQLVATGKALPVRGGLPIVAGGEVIGAIAVGGAPAPGEQDEICSKAGLDRIASRLR